MHRCLGYCLIYELNFIMGMHRKRATVHIGFLKSPWFQASMEGTGDLWGSFNFVLIFNLFFETGSRESQSGLELVT